MNSLRTAYSIKLPPYRVYKQLFSEGQSETETTELYACKARALLAQLPYSLDESAQIDMVYGLLNRKIRKRFVRDSVKTFAELIASARSIEQSLEETEQKQNKPEVRKEQKPPRIRCAYCKSFGHLVADCEAVKHKNERKTTSNKDKLVRADNTEPQKPTISCYGCGEPGVTRTRCQKCNPPKRAENAQSIVFEEFYSNEDLDLSALRPMLPVTICGLNGTAYADTGATKSIMGRNLYHKIRDKCCFTTATVNIKLADGSICSK